MTPPRRRRPLARLFESRSRTAVLKIAKDTTGDEDTLKNEIKIHKAVQRDNRSHPNIATYLGTVPPLGILVSLYTTNWHRDMLLDESTTARRLLQLVRTATRPCPRRHPRHRPCHRRPQWP